MKYLKITNNGELDIRLVALMGGTTKQKDKFKIGKFGTGLKYTLAYLYRNNIDFKCFSGANEVKIHTEKELIGETEFEIICINGNRTSITTQMGNDWTAWMIIREIWCNSLDEGEQTVETVDGGYNNSELNDVILGVEGKTSFYIQVTPELKEVLDNWGRYFIHRETPMWENEDYAIYPSDGCLRLYKQGVLIYQNIETKSVFKYDIKSASINELREYKGIPSLEIQSALSNPNTEVINYFFEHIKETDYEAADMDYNWYAQFGSIWKQAIGSNKIVSYDTYRHVKENSIDVDQIEKAIKLPKNVYKALTKTFEGVGVLRTLGGKNEFYESEDIKLTEKTKESLFLLSKAGYIINADLKIVYGMFADKEKLMALDVNKKELLISQSCLSLELSDFTYKIVELNERFTVKHQDCSREMQGHLVKLFTEQLLKNVKTSVE